MARFFSRNNELKMQRSELSKEVEPRIGRIPFKGRYHKLPRTFEQDYKVSNSVLGKGYNGVVRLASAIHSSGKKRFAVKSFQTKGLQPHKRHQLDCEIEIFLCMDHPHIARLVDVYESTDTITIVMECAEGGELFDRVTSRRFSEEEAADATRQVLLALNYIHSHGIVHRDMKLENILYDTKGSSHLKLIDFGFSKFTSTYRLHTSCGTLAYMAPEVLTRSYTSQCDLWSLGVITFILLSGHMPFHGSEESIQGNITSGTYVMKHAHWKGVSQLGREFTRALLTIDPKVRLDAKAALEHRWFTESYPQKEPNMDSSTIDALLLWRTAPKFHRACMLMMAWLLSNEQQAVVRDHFLALDADHDGAISFKELRDVMVNQFQIAEEEVQQIFDLLDTTHHQEIHYSEFLAAMMASRINMTDDLLQSTFHHFDTGNNGAISTDDFRVLLGDTFEGQPVDDLYAQFLADANIDVPDGKLNYEDFARFARLCAPRKPSGIESTPTRRTFAPKLWRAINGSFHSGGSPMAPSLPTLLRDASPANRMKTPKSAKHGPQHLPVPEHDEVPFERSGSKPVLLPGAANNVDPAAASPAQHRQLAPTQGSQQACCNVQ